jgi:hypothetical protein
MTALRRVIVIVEHGRVVGTQIVEESGPGAGAPAVSARLRAGPAQTLHDLQVQVPSDLSRPGERERFHASLVEKIAGKK